VSQAGDFLFVGALLVYTAAVCAVGEIFWGVFTGPAGP
jgi:hypothetical protein